MSQKEKFARKIKNCRRLVLHQNLQDNTRSHHRYVVLKMWIIFSEVLVCHTIHTVELLSMLWQAGSARIVGNEYIMNHEMKMAIFQSPNFIPPCIGKGLACVSVSLSWGMSHDVREHGCRNWRVVQGEQSRHDTFVWNLPSSRLALTFAKLTRFVGFCVLARVR